MIKAEQAFSSEPCTRDIWRNRILLSVGKRSWHLSREEAAKLSADLTTALHVSEYETFTGILETEGSDFYLKGEDGERVQVAPRDWTLKAREGQAVQIMGRLLSEEHGAKHAMIYLREWSPVED